jgi:hypothetical protein
MLQRRLQEWVGGGDLHTEGWLTVRHGNIIIIGRLTVRHGRTTPA